MRYGSWTPPSPLPSIFSLSEGQSEKFDRMQVCSAKSSDEIGDIATTLHHSLFWGQSLTFYRLSSFQWDEAEMWQKGQFRCADIIFHVNFSKRNEFDKIWY